MKLNKLALLTTLIAAAVGSGWNPIAGPPMASAGDVVQASHGEFGTPACGTPACEEDWAGGIFSERFCNACDDNGEPFSLLGECCGWSAGGWIQLGYHDNDLPLFNSRPFEYQLQQGWLYAEKALDTSSGFDFGGRIDYVYGTDGQDTQAFGIDNDHWDNGFDNGPDYGHALPQVYGEVGYGDWSIKAGHFFTIIGYEVVGAPDNFFYSHAYTFFNSEPFTHTGALATYNFSEDITAYGGYVLGWDSGFEDNGDAFLGGISVDLTDDINVTYATVGGRFSDVTGGVAERGYMHSIVSQVALTEKLNYVSQSDYLDTVDAAGNKFRETIGLNQYLIRTINDKLAIGMRAEWWQVDQGSAAFLGDNAIVGDLGDDIDIFALTLGVNIRPHANVIIRPEFRWDWLDGDRDGLADADVDLIDDNNDQRTFGIDSIFLF